MSSETDQPSKNLSPLNKPYFLSMQQRLEQLTHAPVDTLVLTTTDLERFKCSQCGVCCALPWNIHISKDYYDQWYHHFHQDPSGRFQRPFEQRQNPSQDDFADMRRQDNSFRCIFLEPDNRCYIHINYGEDALPSVCRTYPRMTLRHGSHYGADYLLGSCQSAPGLIAEHNQVYYYFEPPSGDTPLPIHYPNNLFPGELGRNENYLWVSLVLDVLSLDINTPLQRLGSLIHSLEYIALKTPEKITQAQLKLLYREQMQRSNQLNLEIAPENVQKKALEWFFQLMEPSFTPLLDHARRIYLEQAPWPSLAEEERLLLNQFLHAFLLRKVLAMPNKNPFYGEISFFQKFFLLSLHLLMVQMTADYYRSRTQSPLSIKQLSQAVNLIDGRYSQRCDWVQKQRINTLSPEDSLALMQTALSLNLGMMQAL
jgi:Fe-S-cluster containining protein